MSRSKSHFLRAAAIAAATAFVPVTSAVLSPAPAVAQSALPAPYVSRALDAVLLPVDGAVISAFGLAPGSTGVLVLATQPGGLADGAGILPGDVIDFVRGRPVASPVDLDEVVYYWIVQGVSDFVFDGFRAGSAYATETVITLEYWEETIEITEIVSWSSYSYASFSYTEFYEEYSEEISVSYEESLTTIEETVTSEEYTEEMASEEVTDEAVDEATDEAVDAGVGEGVGDCPGEIVDGVCVEGEEGAVEEEAVDEAVEEDVIEDDGGDAGGEEEVIEE